MSTRVALVTGASRGVGAAVARLLSSQGYTVACAARSTADQPRRTPGTLDETVRQIVERGGDAFAIPTDLSDAAQVLDMVDRTVERCGRLDVLVNNAAITFTGGLDIDWDRHRLVFAVGLEGPMLAMRAAKEHLIASGEGRVINVSSEAALVPYEGLLSYGMAKAALERLTVGAAQELAPFGVTVNCFRIDVPVASEGFVANTPAEERKEWEPCEVAAEGIGWMISQPASYSGQLESMFHLRAREGIMASAAEVTYRGPTPRTTPATGLLGSAADSTTFVDG